MVLPPNWTKPPGYDPKVLLKNLRLKGRNPQTEKVLKTLNPKIGEKEFSILFPKQTERVQQALQPQGQQFAAQENIERGAALKKGAEAIRAGEVQRVIQTEPQEGTEPLLFAAREYKAEKERRQAQLQQLMEKYDIPYGVETPEYARIYKGSHPSEEFAGQVAEWTLGFDPRYGNVGSNIALAAGQLLPLDEAGKVGGKIIKKVAGEVTEEVAETGIKKAIKAGKGIPLTPAEETEAVQRMQKQIPGLKQEGVFTAEQKQGIIDRGYDPEKVEYREGLGILEQPLPTVKETGKTIRVFHGSPNKIEQFDIAKASEGNDLTGIYFTKDKNVAIDMGSREMNPALKEKPFVGEYEITLKNPADEATVEKVIAQLEEDGIVEPQLADMTTDELKAMGYDGVIRDIGFGDEYIVFDSKNIKLVKETAGQIPPTKAPPSPETVPGKGIGRVVSEKPLETQVSGQPPVKPPEPPKVTTGAIPPEKPGFAGNIKLSKYPDDVQEVLKKWVDENPEKIVEARRGVRSDAQVLEDAHQLVDDLGGDFQRLQKKWKPGEAWNAEEILAIRGTLRSKSEEVLNLAKIASQDNSSANLLKLSTAITEQARIQEVVTGITAESGRALRQFRQQAFDALKSNDASKIEEILKRLGTNRKQMQEVADALAKIDINDPVAVNNFIRNMSKPKLWDYVTELWYNSILSGPKTHVINSLSNTFTAITSPIERATAAVIEAPLARLQGRQVERFMREVPADAFGAVEGIKEGIHSAAYTMKYGITPGQATKWEFTPKAFKGVTGRIINAPSTALEMADQYYRSVNFRAAYNALAERTAKMEGKVGTKLLDRVADLKLNPTKNMIDDATRLAEYRLFRQESGTFVSSLMRLRDSFPPLRFVIPFLRTPVNLLKFGLERSPLGIFNPKLWRNLAKKSPEAADQLARVTLGSGIAAFAAWQFSEGRITGSAPEDREERDRFYREGKLPYSVKIGGKWISYQRLEPLNQTLSQVAAVIDAVKSNDKTVDQKAMQAVSTISENLVSQTYMSSISDLINFLSEPEQNPYFLQRQVAGLMPFSSLSRTVAQMIDTTIREPRTIGEQFKANIPSLSEQVPPKLTVFGEESKRQTPAWSPISVSTEIKTPIDKELERLSMDIGFVGTSIGGEKLSREEQLKYQRDAGQLTYERLYTLFNTDMYLNAETEIQRTMIDREVEYSRTAVKYDLPLKLYDDYFTYNYLRDENGDADQKTRRDFRKSHPEFEEWGEKYLGWKPLSGSQSPKTTPSTVEPYRGGTPSYLPKSMK